MQLVPRYLVNNRVNIIANLAGFVVEYRPVYSRQIEVFRGIENKVQFRLLNADQKPVSLTNYTPKFLAFDENKTLIIEHDGVQVTSDGSTPIKGLFEITITENDLLNVKDQFLYYTIYLNDTNDTDIITYSDEHFRNDSIIKVTSTAFPGPKPSKNITTFMQLDDLFYVSESVNAEPGINGNDALHTAAIYTDGYVGNIVIQATLDNQITDFSNWADIDTVSFDGTETNPVPVNFNGVYSHLRFKTDASPADTITKILIRN